MDEPGDFAAVVPTAALAAVSPTTEVPDDVDLSAVVAAAVEGTSGPELAAVLGAVGGLADVDGYALVEIARGWEKVARHARAQVLRAVGELGARRDVQIATGALPDHTDRRAPQVAYFAASEVSLALGISAGAADGLLADAVLLTSRLPQVLAALEDGRPHERSAHVLAEETVVLDDATATAVADAVLSRQALRTVPQILRATRTAVASADPATAATRERWAVKGRFVRPYKAITDGMVAWEGYLPVAESMAVWERLCAIGEATKVPGDLRGVDARRVDAAVALLLGAPLSTLGTRTGFETCTTGGASGADASGEPEG